MTQLEEAPPEPLALLPWSTNLVLLHKIKNPATRLWCARKALEHGWSRAVLTVQIETKLHKRSGKAVTIFEQTLPPAQSDMARQVLKEPEHRTSIPSFSTRTRREFIATGAGALPGPQK